MTSQAANKHQVTAKTSIEGVRKKTSSAAFCGKINDDGWTGSVIALFRTTPADLAPGVESSTSE
jgi:hypothetical protein